MSKHKQKKKCWNRHDQVSQIQKHRIYDLK